MNNSTPINYFLYVRKSSESEDRQMASIQDQIEVMTAFAKDRGLQIADIISESKSAKEPGRPRFTEMIKRFHAGEADGVLCWKLNRLARNPIDGGTISWMLQRKVIRHIQTFSGDFKPSDNVLMMQVEFGIANEYVKNLSEDVIRGLSMKAKRGWFPCNKVPLGYMHNMGYAMGENEIIPDPKKHSLVKHLWDLMLSRGLSIRGLQREAKLIGLTSSKGKDLSCSVLHRMLNNPFYAGFFTWNHPDEGTVKHKGRHLPMISLEEFNRVQMILGRRGSRFRTGQKYEFKYRGPFSCGECGCHITAEHKLQVICTECKTKFSAKTRTTCTQCGLDISEMNNPSVIDKTYYRCTKNAGICNQRGVEEKNLEQEILTALNTIHIPLKMARVIMPCIEKVEIIDNEQVSDKLHEQYKTEKRKWDNLISMRMNGEIDQDTFLKRKNRSEELLVSLESRMANVEATNTWKDKAKHDLQVATQISSILEKKKPEALKRLFREVASNPVIKGQKPIFNFKSPYSFFKKVYENHLAEIESFEPSKPIENQGFLGGLSDACSIGRADWNRLRTYYQEERD
ncbi:MAG: recombinase family protein [Bacteroidota bacterium]